MLLSFCFCFVFTDVIKHYTSLEGNLKSISCPLQYRAAQTFMRQSQSQTANLPTTPCKAMVIFPLGFESAFLRVFLIPIKSGLNNPLALMRARYCNNTNSRSGWVQGGCLSPADIQVFSVLCWFSWPLGEVQSDPPGSQTAISDLPQDSSKSHHQCLRLRCDHSYLHIRIAQSSQLRFKSLPTYISHMPAAFFRVKGTSNARSEGESTHICHLRSWSTHPYRLAVWQKAWYGPAILDQSKGPVSPLWLVQCCWSAAWTACSLDGLLLSVNQKLGTSWIRGCFWTTAFQGQESIFPPLILLHIQHISVIGQLSFSTASLGLLHYLNTHCVKKYFFVRGVFLVSYCILLTCTSPKFPSCRSGTVLLISLPFWLTRWEKPGKWPGICIFHRSRMLSSQWKVVC